MKGIKNVLLLLCITASLFILSTAIGLSLTSLALASVLLMVASAVHLAAHELGHLIGGWISGYRLVSLQIGPIHLQVKSKHKRALSLQNTRGGQCVMLPPQGDAVPFLAYHLGGVCANALVSAAGILQLSLCAAWPTLFSVQLLFLGLIKIWVNQVPRMEGGIPNDGCTVMLLRRDAAIRRDYAAYLSLYAAIIREEPISPEEYSYPRTPGEDPEGLLYYHEIQRLLAAIQTSSAT